MANWKEHAGGQNHKAKFTLAAPKGCAGIIFVGRYFLEAYVERPDISVKYEEFLLSEVDGAKAWVETLLTK